MDIPHNLIQQIRTGKAVLFLGAGASWGATSPTEPKKPPLGKELCRLLSDEFLGGDSTDKPLSLVAEYCIDAADLRSVQAFIANIFNPFRPTTTHKNIANFNWAALVTTNYDQIIEKAYSENNKRLQTPVPILRNTDRVDQLLRAPDSVPLIKLHGCVSIADDIRYPLILTIDQYIEHREGRKKLFSRFTELAGEYSVVYVGYQIEDPDIRAILQELTAPEMSRPRHYVVTPNPSDRDRRIWESKQITTINGTFDEFMSTLQSVIPTAFRGIRSTTQSHPIASKFSSHVAASEDLLTFLANDATYVYRDMPSDKPNASAFFKGASYGWGAIISKFDAERTLTDSILSEIVLTDDSDRPRSTDFYLIKGYAGSGKTVLLKRIAYEAATTFDKVALFIRSDAHLNIAPIAELSSLIGERLFIFIDGVARRATECELFLRAARSSKLPLTIIVTERTNEWNVDANSLSSLLDNEYQLKSLSLKEINAVIAKLEEHQALGILAGKNIEEQREAFHLHADRQLLIALYEITSGKSFEEIVFDEYRNIVNNRARNVYLIICALNRLNVPVRAGLVNRLAGVSFHDFKEQFFAPLESVVITETYEPARDMAYRARHPWVAKTIFEHALPNEIDRFDLYLSIIRELDVGYTPDRTAFREFVRAKNLRDLFSDPLLIEEIFHAAENSSPNDGYVFQQKSIYEMKRQNGNLTKAHSFISYARDLLPHDKSITHTISELELLRATLSRTHIERDIHLQQARLNATKLTGNQATSSHGYDMLVRLALRELQEVLGNASASDEEVATAVKDVEQALSNGLEKFKSDAYLLVAEADFSALLDNQERAVKALTKAIARNPASPFIAKSLSRLNEKRGDLLAASSALEGALRVLPGDKSLNAALASLIDRNFPDKGLDAEKHWRRSFTQGDANYTSQFWFARRLYLNGKIEEALNIFAQLRLARVPREIKIKISGLIREHGQLKQYAGIISRLEADYAWVTPYGQQRSIYLSSAEISDTKWQSLHRGGMINFKIGFNYLGPAATACGL